MKSKKSSLDKKNISKVFSSELCRVLTVISIASLILFSLASNVYALSWNDKQWGGAGCPNSGIGKWKSDDSNVDNEKIMLVQKNRVSIITNNNSEKQFLYKKTSLHAKGKFIELSGKLIDGEKQMYIKIRPHLISPTEGARDTNKSSFKCLIKVFQYSSPKDAKFDKYSSWDIYQLKNTR